MKQLTNEVKQSAALAYMQGVMMEMIQDGIKPEDVDIKEVAILAENKMLEMLASKKVDTAKDAICERVYSQLH